MENCTTWSTVSVKKSIKNSLNESRYILYKMSVYSNESGTLRVIKFNSVLVLVCVV